MADWQDGVGDSCAHYLDPQEVFYLSFNDITSGRGLFCITRVFLPSLASVANVPTFLFFKNPQTFPLCGNLKDFFFCSPGFIFAEHSGLFVLPIHLTLKYFLLI